MKFEFGLVLGRFQCLHKGHMQIIDLCRQVSKKTLILIGSSQESGTKRNPFSVEMRRKMLEKVYEEAEDIIIGVLPDMTNEDDICYEWGKYILHNVAENYGAYPDLMVYGKDESRKGWFSKEDSSLFSEMIIARDKIKISATELRKYLVEEQREEWQKYVPEQIWDMYDELKNELLK